MAPAVTREILLTYGALAVSSVANGTGAYTLAATPPGWVLAGGVIAFFGCANAANNGVFTISSVVGNVVTTSNTSSVAEGSGGKAAFPVAGPSNFHHHDKYKFKNAYKTRAYTFDIVLTGTTSYASFKVYCDQAQIAFRTPRQRFRVSFSGTVFEDMNPEASSGGNTGFNQDAEIEKLGDDFDTSRSRGWRVMLTIQLPADLAGQSGRQDSEVRVDYEPSRRRIITISGRYTAIGVNDATAQYQASIGAYASAIQSAVASGDGSTYELVEESFTHDDADKNCDFVRKYEEVIYDQVSGTRNDAGIVKGRYSYSRQQIAPGDSDPATVRLEIIECEFDCSIDKTVSTSLEDYWTSSLKGYLLAQARSRLQLGQVALTDHQYKTDPSLNRIMGRMTIQATSTGGSNLVQSRYSTRVETNNGKVLVGTWDGNALSYHVYDGKAKLLRNRRWTKLLLGSVSGGGNSGGSNGATIGASFGGGIVGGGSIRFNFLNGFSVGGIGGPQTGAQISALVEAAISDGPPPGGEEAAGAAAVDLSGWIPLGDVVTITPITIGLPGNQITLTEVERETFEQYVEPPTGGGGGGPGGGTAT